MFSVFAWFNSPEMQIMQFSVTHAALPEIIRMDTCQKSVKKGSISFRDMQQIAVSLYEADPKPAVFSVSSQSCWRTDPSPRHLCMGDR